MWIIAAAAFLALTLFAAPFPAIILGAGLMGLLGGRLAPAVFQSSGGHAKTVTSHGPALIDDHTPPPPYTRFSWPRLLRFVGIGLLLWGGLLGLLAALFGWHGAPTQIGGFFTKAALLTFGGAYAVLPYVYQGGVEQYACLLYTSDAADE